MNSVVYGRGLTKHYGAKTALDGIDLDIGAGRIVGLIGPNGAGKTTAMKAMLGLIDYEGDLRVLELEPRRERWRLMHQVCFIADVAVLPRWARIWQLLEFIEGVHPRFSRQRCLDMLARTKLSLNDRVRGLSKGEVVQLHLSLILAIDARLLVLDEPTLGLDILFRKAFYQTLLDDYFDGEKTILVSTHQVEEVEHILTDLLFIGEGQITLAETMDAVTERYSELVVRPERVEAARALGPLHERQLMGRHVFLFDGVDRGRLAELGEIHTASVADLFVATMQKEGVKV